MIHTVPLSRRRRANRKHALKKPALEIWAPPLNLVSRRRPLVAFDAVKSSGFDFWIDVVQPHQDIFDGIVGPCMGHKIPVGHVAGG